MDNEGFDWWNESLNHDPQHCILHGFCFERFHYYQTFIFSNLFNLEKFSAFINSFSAFFASSPPLFYRYCLFSAFFAFGFLSFSLNYEVKKSVLENKSLFQNFYR